MIIRRFETKDAEALAKLSKIASRELKWWEIETAKDFLIIFRKNKNLIWIAEDKKKIIGFLYGDILFKKGILKSNRALELANTYVVKEHRNKGVATKLTKRFLNAWKNSSYKTVFSFATNKIALSLLKDLGFKQKVYYLDKKL